MVASGEIWRGSGGGGGGGFRHGGGGGGGGDGPPPHLARRRARPWVGAGASLPGLPALCWLTRQPPAARWAWAVAVPGSSARLLAQRHTRRAARLCMGGRAGAAALRADNGQRPHAAPVRGNESSALRGLTPGAGGAGLCGPPVHASTQERPRLVGGTGARHPQT